MPVLPTRSAGAAPYNTTSSAVPGGATIWILLVKAVITPWVPTFLASVGSPATASVELPFPLRVQVISELAD